MLIDKRLIVPRGQQILAQLSSHIQKYWPDFSPQEILRLSQNCERIKLLTKILTCKTTRAAFSLVLCNAFTRYHLHFDVCGKMKRIWQENTNGRIQVL